MRLKLRKMKRKYKKPKIVMKIKDKPTVVAVSCQKIIGENELCNSEPEM